MSKVHWTRHRLDEKVLAVLLILSAWFDYMVFIYPNNTSAATREQVNNETVSRTELTLKRTENSQTFALGNNTYALETASERLFYLSGGSYQKIENSIVNYSEGDYLYRNKANSIHLNAGATAEIGIQYEYGDAKLAIRPENSEIDINLLSPAVIDHNKITYKDLYPAVDWEITVSSSTVTNELVVKSEDGIRQSYGFVVASPTGHIITVENNGSLILSKGGGKAWQTAPAIMHDSKTYQSVNIELKDKLLIKPDASWLKESSRSFPVRIDPSISFNATADTFVSPSTLNPANGQRRMMTIGDYSDYTLPSNPLFANSRALINYGVLNLPSNAIIQSSYVSLWHYGTNSGRGVVYVARATSSWSESTVWPGPSYTGNYGSMLFPSYNSDTTAVERQINVDISLVNILRSSNNGIMVRNVDEGQTGVVVCASEIPSGPCHSGNNPKITVIYTLNQPPVAANLNYPNEGWEIGPLTSGMLAGTTCDLSGIGLGCNVEHHFQTEDPDNTFPLYTTVQVRSTEGTIRDFTKTVSGEGWLSHNHTLPDGHWSWLARTQDRYGAWSPWSVTKNFVVDTTSPDIANMNPEPQFSPGTQNDVLSNSAADNIIGGVQYQFQVADTPDFSSIIQDSGWIDANTFSFAGLDNETEYFYRVRSKDRLNNTNDWGDETASTQDGVFPDIAVLELESVVISPKNQDGNFDSTVLTYGINENHFSDIAIELYNTENGLVRAYNELSQAGTVEIDGKDGLGNWLADGFYSVKVTAKDFAGNTTVDDTKVLKIDNISAVINVSFPENNAWFNFSPLHASGITDSDAVLTISNLSTGELISANIDPGTGIFTESIGDVMGTNSFVFDAMDPVGNKSSIQITTYREDATPVIDTLFPDSLIGDDTPLIAVRLHDVGYIDLVGSEFTSGIDPESVYLELKHNDFSGLVLVNEGVNVHPELGHASFSCIGYDCVYGYALDSALQPDGQYSIITALRDNAGNQTSATDDFELDSHTLISVSTPSDGTLFNYSSIGLRGVAERGATLTVYGLIDSDQFLIDPNTTAGRVTVENCRSSDNPTRDGIKEVCDWIIDGFALDKNLDVSRNVINPVKYTARDPVGNIQTITHEYVVNLYAVNLLLGTDIEFFSPNGDGRQDGIRFVDLFTDGQIDTWEIQIRRTGGLEPIRVLSGNSALPSDVYWDGKYTPGDPYAEGTQYVEDGDYTYVLQIMTTDGIKFETSPVTLFARTELNDEIVITYPKNNTVTMRGVTNVQGQAPAQTTVHTCVDTISLPSDCDIEYTAVADENGSFSLIVPLIRLEGQDQTEHFISATAIDEYGNKTPKSNIVRVVTDVADPFVEISAIPALSGVNNAEAYQIIIDKLNQGESITEGDIASLRSIILRSVVTHNTERVKLSFAEYTNLSELPTEVQFNYIGYIDQRVADDENKTGLYEQYQEGVNPVFVCNDTHCTWDFYYPVPPVTGGVYEFEFEGKKAETIESLSAAVLVDGTIPASPIILDVNKIIGGETLNTNLYQSTYYLNSELIEVIGASDPNMDIRIEDQNSNVLCEITANGIGLFYCNINVSIFYPEVNTQNVELSLLPIASDGQNEVPGLSRTNVAIDKISPEIISLEALNQWRKSGALARLTVTGSEPIFRAVLQTPEGTKHNYLLLPNSSSGTAPFIIPGTVPEGVYGVNTTITDLAGNQDTQDYQFFIDNTPPDPENIIKNTQNGNWGEYSGIQAYSDTPANGRLVPEYVIRGNTLVVHGITEKNTIVSINVDGNYVADAEVSSTLCERLFDDLITDDGVIVRSGEKCDWSYTYNFSGERGYVFTTRVYDRSGNRSLVSKDEIVYYDKTVPIKPEATYPKITNKLQATVTLYAEALSDIEYWEYSPDNVELRYKYLQNGGDGKDIGDFGLGSKVDSGSCIKVDENRRIGTCEDGEYKFNVKSTDAAGNASNIAIFHIERDTVAPSAPKVTLAVEGSSIVTSVTGEPFSAVQVNEKESNFDIDSDGTTKATLVKYYQGETKYTFDVALVDLAGNTSAKTTVSIATPATGMGEGTVEGAKSLNPWAEGKYSWNPRPASVELYLRHDGSSYFKNEIIPKPAITYIDWDLENYYVYGYGPYYIMPFQVRVYKEGGSKTYTLGEALDTCEVRNHHSLIFIMSNEEFNCTQNLLGISKFTLSLWLKSLPLSFSFKGNSHTENHKLLGTVDTIVSHALIHVYKNGNWQEAPSWPSWRVAGGADSKGKFKFDWPLELMKNPDNLSVTVKLYGSFDWDGKNYDYLGLESPRSDEKTIPNTTIDGVTAVVLDVPYFNQYLEPDGTKNPKDGWKMCGAASAVMVAGYFEKLSYDESNEHSLKKYQYSKSGQDWIKSNKCGGGAFDITSGGGCSSSAIAGIKNYLSKTTGEVYSNAERIKFDDIKRNINQHKPVIYDVGEKGDLSFGHILIIIGYTSDGRLIVNDPYTDLEEYGSNWSYYDSGKQTVYQYESTYWNPKWYIYNN